MVLDKRTFLIKVRTTDHASVWTDATLPLQAHLTFESGELLPADYEPRSSAT